MRRVTLIPALSCFLLLGALQTTAAAQTAAKKNDSCTIAGTIIGADTGQPLHKAWVTLTKIGNRQSSQSAITDASGHFRLKDIAPGRYDLWAAHNGYVRQQYGQRGNNPAGTTLTLSPGQHMPDVSFRLIRAAALSGHVFDEDGDPIEGAQVQALKFGYMQGHRRLLPQRFANTDDRGAYRLYGLPPGEYIIGARENSYQGGAQSGQPGFAPGYYPGTTDPGQATPVTVHGGDDFPGLDFNLPSVKTVTVSGHVSNSVTGRPGMGTSLFLTPRGGDAISAFYMSFQTYLQGPQGKFKLTNVVPGSYFLVGVTNVNGKQYASRVPIDVSDSDLTGINLVISPGITVSGHVEGLDKTALQALHVYIRPHGLRTYFSILAPVTPKADGSFILDNVNDGSYDVNVGPLPKDAYIKDIRAGDQSILTSGLQITGGQVPGDLDIQLRPDGGKLDGTVVKDDKPFGGATVVLIPDDKALRKDFRWYETATTDQYGNFSWQGIRPGKYKIFAWENIERGAYQDPAFLQKYEDQGKAVEVKEGGQASLRVQLITSTNSD